MVFFNEPLFLGNSAWEMFHVYTAVTLYGMFKVYKSNRQNHLERRGIFNCQDYVLRNGVILAEDIVDTNKTNKICG